VLFKLNSVIIIEKKPEEIKADLKYYFLVYDEVNFETENTNYTNRNTDSIRNQ
jgi:hypothetical protein